MYFFSLKLEKQNKKINEIYPFTHVGRWNRQAELHCCIL